MKSERRHELQQNELADWIGEHIEAMKPYATQISLAVAGIAVAVLLGFWLLRGDTAVSASNWSSYFAALNQPRPQDREKSLEEVNTKSVGSPAALWAKMSIGDASAEAGGRAMFTDRSEAQTQLKKAVGAYQDVEARATDPALKARARLGLGKVYESLCKPAEALKYYELAAEGLKGTAIGKSAAADAARMKDPRQIAMLEWFSTQTPKRPAPFPGMGGGIPGLPNDLPARPDLSVPSFAPPGGLGLDNIGTGVPAVPGPEFPTPGAPTPPGATTPPAPGATPSPAPGATTPPDSKTAPEKPADAKPADAKSADGKSTEPPAGTPKGEAPKTEQPKTEAPKSEP